MKHNGWMFALVAAGLLAGCSQSAPGTSRSLGRVDYGLAFATASETMSQYYSVAAGDPVTGVITARPKDVSAAGGLILGGGSPARQVATLRLIRDGGFVVAQVSVAVQRQTSEVLSGRVENYSSVPNATPAEGEAATSREQNQTWQHEKYARDIERKILKDLFAALHPESP